MAFDFLNDLGKKLTQAGQGAAQQTKIFAETAKIHSIISDEEKQLNNIYMQIGKRYFEDNKDNPTAEYSDLIITIKDAQVRIDKYKEQIKVVKGVRNCPSCGAEVASSAAFCNACGVQMPVVAPVVEQAASTCPQCGAATSNGATFCNICGCNLAQKAPLGNIPTSANSISTPVNSTIPTPVNNTIPTPVNNIPEVNSEVKAEVQNGVNLNKDIF